MRFPRPLRQGGCVGLICPSSPVQPERMDRCVKFLCRLGYRVKEGKSCRMAWRGYLAGPDEVRAEDINRMFADPEVDAVFCVRGGNGTCRIMTLLDYEMIRRNPKIFVGYSDVTNLLLAFNRLCGFVTYHGPMVSSNMADHYDEYTRLSFEGLLAMKNEWEFRNPPGMPPVVLTAGAARGQLTGGNLSLVSDMLGTFYMPDFRGKILFLEDIGERVANVDRMLWQLRHLGVFEQIAGLVFGDFADSVNNYDESFGINSYLRDEFCRMNIPVLCGLKAGHCFPTGSLAMGAECELDADRGTLRFFREQEKDCAVWGNVV